MKTFYVDYTTENGELFHVWVTAESHEEAINEALSEYWDIDEIVNVRER